MDYLLNIYNANKQTLLCLPSTRGSYTSRSVEWILGWKAVGLRSRVYFMAMILKRFELVCWSFPKIKK